MSEYISHKDYLLFDEAGIPRENIAHMRIIKDDPIADTSVWRIQLLLKTGETFLYTRRFGTHDLAVNTMIAMLSWDRECKECHRCL